MITIYTDGSAHPDGRGGAAAVLSYRGRRREVVASYSATTNQRMELTALLLGLETLNPLAKAMQIIVVSDSMYLIGGMTAWVENWKANGWRNASRKPVANQDLWKRLDAAADGLAITYEHVRGHTGELGNEEVHRLAEEAMRSA